MMSRELLIPVRRIGPRSAGMLMSAREFDSLPDGVFDDRYRYELIHGVLVVVPPAGPAERDPNEELGHLLRKYKTEHPNGSALDKTLPEETILAGEDRRRCDRAIWTGLGRVPVLEEDVPSIVVEFVSAARRDHRRDYEEKLREYRAIAVREYWIIDRFQRTMSVYRNPPGEPDPLIVRESETYQADLLAGFVLPLARLFSLSDDWPKKRRRPRQ